MHDNKVAPEEAGAKVTTKPVLKLMISFFLENFFDTSF